MRIRPQRQRGLVYDTPRPVHPVLPTVRGGREWEEELEPRVPLQNRGFGFFRYWLGYANDAELFCRDHGRNVTKPECRDPHPRTN